MLQAILLDRDGVINQERSDYVKSWDEFQFLPRILVALRQLAELQIPIGVITNQSAIGRGHVTALQVNKIHQRLVQIVEEHGGRIDAFFVCPHHPDDQCTCRKPKPGLLYQSAQHFGVDLAHCVFVGDAFTDFQAATTAQCKTILVTSGRQGPDLPRLLQNVNRNLKHNTRHNTEETPIVPDLFGAAEILKRYARDN